MKHLLIVIILFTGIQSLFAIPFTQVMDLKRYEQMARDKFMEAGEERKKLPAPDLSNPNDPNTKKYYELNKKMAIYKDKMWKYNEAQKYNTHFLYVIKDTVIWSAQDAWEMATILFNTNTLNQIISQEWTSLVKSSYDAMFKMKIRKMIKETLGYDKNISGLEDQLMAIILPDVQKSELWKKIEQGADKGLDKLKEQYQQAAMKNFKKEWLKKTKGMNKKSIENMAKKHGAKIMTAATRIIDSVNFTADILQKVYFWNEYEPSIRKILAQILLIKNKYIASGQSLSGEDLYLVWSGKKKIPLVAKKTNQGKLADTPQKREKLNDSELNKMANRIKADKQKLADARQKGLASDAKDLRVKIIGLTKIYTDNGGNSTYLEIKSTANKELYSLKDEISTVKKQIQYSKQLGNTSVLREQNAKLKYLLKQYTEKGGDTNEL